ncbi:MAG TPA: SusC/RagA family TonB-linked outer membrane protein, partial [Prolixibacteraceae bacterium]|nr:SusC/RagA family TonB-linked outer membrane protein [Prolixibacteraceae bacterium]
MENSSIENILLNIENQSEFRFFYNGKIDVDRKISVSCEDKLVTELLNEIFEETNIRYKVMGRQISLSADSSGLNGAQEERNVSGKVTDSSGAPLPGVTVIVKGTTQGIITDFDGKYTLANVPSDATLMFSFVGMKTQE